MHSKKDVNDLMSMTYSCWMKKQVLQRNTFKNQTIFLKDKKYVNDLMHMSWKQILMLTTFDM
jgi:hypothetical protein